MSKAELPEEQNEGESVCQEELLKGEKEGAYVCEGEHEKIAGTNGEAISTKTYIDEIIQVVFVDDNKGSTSMMISEHCKEIILFETKIINLEIEFNDDNIL